MDLKSLKAEIDKLPRDKRAEAIDILLRLEDQRSLQESRKSFLPFVKRMWPDFIAGNHHAIMSDALDRVARGDLKRLIINMPPRHTKSQFGSLYFPSWYLGLFPHRKVIQASHTAELAVDFGRHVRNRVNSAEFAEIFPGVNISSDSKAAGRWATNKGGQYFAVGVGGAMTGKGADILIIDDPHDEQEAAQAMGNPAIFDRTYEWYTSGPRQRLQPGGSIVIIMTRWAKNDLTGKLVQKAINTPDGDQWEVIELPAILPSGAALWPEYWRAEELERIKLSLPVSKWQAQYQQQPTSEEGALIKRNWWKRWPEDKPPKCEIVIQSWDTAFLKTERSDYSACTTWGIFYHPDDNGIDRPNIIMLHAMREKMEFPELKQRALDMFREWNPDQTVVEKKASGAPLIFELRQMGIPVMEYTPSRGNDKMVRVNSISDMFSSGFVWAPDRRWAEDVIEECAAFPNGEHDDYVDSVVYALMRFRQGGYLRVPLDEEEDELPPREVVEYY